VVTCPRCGYSLRGPVPEAVSTKSAEPPRSEIQKPEGPREASQASSPPGIEQRFRQIYTEEGAIPAIKYWREVTGTSLAKAKAFYDREKAAGRLGETRPPQRQSCIVALVAGFLAVTVAAGVILMAYSCSHSTAYHQSHAKRVLHHHH
jgi:hypothetical protein